MVAPLPLLKPCLGKSLSFVGVIQTRKASGPVEINKKKISTGLKGHKAQTSPSVCLVFILLIVVSSLCQLFCYFLLYFFFRQVFFHSLWFWFADQSFSLSEKVKQKKHEEKKRKKKKKSFILFSPNDRFLAHYDHEWNRTERQSLSIPKQSGLPLESGCLSGRLWPFSNSLTGSHVSCSDKSNSAIITALRRACYGFSGLHAQMAIRSENQLVH